MQHIFQFTRVAQPDDPLIQPHELRLADDHSVNMHVAEKPLFELHRLVKLVKQPGVGIFQLGMPRADIEQFAQDMLRGRVGEHVIDLVAALFQRLNAAPHVSGRDVFPRPPALALGADGAVDRHRPTHAEERLALDLVHLSAPQVKHVFSGLAGNAAKQRHVGQRSEAVEILMVAVDEAERAAVAIQLLNLGPFCYDIPVDVLKLVPDDAEITQDDNGIVLIETFVIPKPFNAAVRVDRQINTHSLRSHLNP